MSRIGQGIKKSILTANSVLYAVTASVPAALSMAASRILGRKSSGNIAAMTVAELLTLIGVEAGAKDDLTGSEIVTLLEALAGGSQLSHDQLDDVSTSDHHTKYTDANARAAAVSDAVYGAGWNGVTTIAPSKNAVYDKIETLGGAILTVAETEVFNGTAPTAWTDLNLSGVIGSQVTLVLLKYNGLGGTSVAVRKNGDTDEFFPGNADSSLGCAASYQVDTDLHIVLLVATDASGIIEWKTSHSLTATIDVIAYIK